MTAGMSGSVQANKKAIIAAVVVGMITVYLVYSYLFASTVTQADTELNVKLPGENLHTFESWKTKAFVDIPQEVVDKMKTIQVSEHHVDLQFDGQVS